MVDIILDLNDLTNVSGGARKDMIKKAYCKQCGKELEYLRTDHFGGCSYNVYFCKNENCTEVGKEKDNSQVVFPLN